MVRQYPHLLVSRSFSKAYGLAGIRLGTCFSSKEIIAVLNTIKPPYNINTLTQNAAIDALQTNEVDEAKRCCGSFLNRCNQLHRL